MNSILKGLHRPMCHVKLGVNLLCISIQMTHEMGQNKTKPNQTIDLIQFSSNAQYHQQQRHNKHVHTFCLNDIQMKTHFVFCFVNFFLQIYSIFFC